jgi:hypothetical protein
MFFDAVIDEESLPLFNGTKGECIDWLRRYPNLWDDKCAVVIGSTLSVVRVREYIEPYLKEFKE